jgi:ribosomal protein S17
MEKETNQNQEMSLETYLEELFERATYDDELREAVNKIFKKFPPGDSVYEVKKHPIVENLETKLKKYEAESKKMKEELDKIRAQKLMEQYYAVMDRYGISRDEIDKVREYCLKNGIQNWDLGCRLYAQEKVTIQSTRPISQLREIMKEDTPSIEKFTGMQGRENFKNALLKEWQKLLGGGK